LGGGAEWLGKEEGEREHLVFSLGKTFRLVSI